MYSPANLGLLALTKIIAEIILIFNSIYIDILNSVKNMIFKYHNLN